MAESAPTPEQVLARTIRAHRDRLHITAQQLADRITDLGGKVGRQAISKIENGERGVSVDELFVLAKALGTAPLLLLFPVGAERVIQYLPGRVVDVWSGARWFSGEAYESEDVATHWAIPLYLFRKHDRLLDEYRGIIDVMIVETSEERKAARVARAEEALRSLRTARAEIRRHGLTPPDLGDDLQHIDARTYAFLTPEAAAELQATGAAIKPVDYRPLGTGGGDRTER